MKNAHSQTSEAGALDTRILANSSENIKADDILATHYCRCCYGATCVFCRILDCHVRLAELQQRQVA